MSRNPAAVLLFFCLAALTAPPVATAQPAEEDPASLFVEQVDVNVVNVEVFVLDGEGRRVTGLTRDDFELYEDGEQVEITNFYAISRADRVAASLPAEGAEIPPPPRVPEEQQLNLVVYVDHSNIMPVNRTRVIEELKGFLEDRAFQGDNVMLVGFDRRVEVLQPFTRDRGAIDSALDRMSRRGGTQRSRQRSDLRNAMISINMYADGGSADGLQFGSGGGNFEPAYDIVRAYVQQARQELRLSTRGLESMVRSLAGLPGRKALLYVSDGLSQRPGEVLYQHLVDAFGAAAISAAAADGKLLDPFLETLQEDESHLFNGIVREANAQQITLYTLDATGGKGSSLGVPAASSDLSRNQGGAGSLAAMENLSMQEPLVDLAVGTGGTSILNTLNFGEVLAHLGEDFDSFYSLGYQAPDAGDGEYHDLEVRLKRPGLSVRHRGGYLDKPQVERIADRTYASLYLDLESNPLGVSVDFGRPDEGRRGRFELPVLVRIPLRQVTLLPQGNEQQGQLEIFVVVEDEHGVSELHRIPYQVKVPRAQLAQALDQDIGYGMKLAIRSGQPTVAVGVWDRVGGDQSFIQKQVIVEGSPSRSR